jgi:hypothetical protein
MQRILVPLYTLIFWNRLLNREDIPRRSYIVKVRGWRTMLIDNPHGRETITPLFKFWKWYI